MSGPIPTVLIAQSTPRQEDAWRAVFMSNGFNVKTVPRGESLAQVASAAGGRKWPGDLLVVDLAELEAEDLSLPAFGDRLRAGRPGLKLVATLGRRLEVAEGERRWARKHGAVDLFPALVLAAEDADTTVRLAAVFAAVGRPLLDAPRLIRFLGVLAAQAVEPAAGAPDAVAALAARGVDPASIAARMRGPSGVPRADRRHHLTVWPNCFVGTEAVDWMAKRYGFDREFAVAVGQALLERGVLHHVVKDHPFRDEPLFYRFAGSGPAIDAVDIDELAKRMRGPRGVEIRDRGHRGKTYPACFVGADAVTWIARTYEVTREDAVSLGQRLVDLGFLRHVLDEHDFIDGHYFYRFEADRRG